MEWKQSLYIDTCLSFSLEAAFCTAFFGFLWSSKLTVPYQDAYYPSVHLSVQDVSVITHNVHIYRISSKRSTIPFCQGVSIYLGKTDSNVCPVTAILLYVLSIAVKYFRTIMYAP